MSMLQVGKEFVSEVTLRRPGSAEVRTF